MLKILKHKEIDFEKWDNCISSSRENLIYGLSWYLNIITPGWKALVYESGEDYKIVLPLTENSKFCITYLRQPFFAQQLGIFGIGNEEIYVAEIFKFLLKSYPIVDLNFNTHNTHIIHKRREFSDLLSLKTTFVLSLKDNYNQIVQSYSTNHKRNIKKALRNNLHIEEGEDFNLIINLFRKTKGVEIKDVKDRDYHNLFKIYKACSHRGFQKLYIAKNKDNVIVAGGLFLIFQSRIIYLFGATSHEGKEQGAMMLIFDEVIKNYSESEYLLDFEGGEIEGIGRFYKGFGGEPATYYRLYKSKIPLKNK